MSYITTWRKNILSKGHSKCKGPEERGLVLLEDMQGSQGLELSEVHSEMEGLKWEGGGGHESHHKFDFLKWEFTGECELKTTMMIYLTV